MHSFRQSAPMVRDSRPLESLPAMRAVLEAVSTANEYRLNQPLTPFVQFLALLNLAIVWLRGPAPSPCLAPEKVRLANACFKELFSGRLPQWTESALADPRGYLDAIDQYERRQGHKLCIPFNTENDHYRLIVKDPLRIQEEHFLYRAILDNRLLEEGPFAAVDLGTGSGRLAFCMADLLQRCIRPGSYELHGLDINPLNIKDALESKNTRGYGPEVKFVTGDMCATPFAEDRFSFCSSASSVYLVSSYGRALCILEMVRILKPGGEGIITGPNEYFTTMDYTYCMGASNFKTYLNPLNMAVAQKLGPLGLLIEKAAAQRLDFELPDTGDLCLALEKAGCEILQVVYWPKSNLQPVLSAVRFRKTAAAVRRTARYAAFMREWIKERGVRPI